MLEEVARWNIAEMSDSIPNDVSEVQPSMFTGFSLNPFS
jgi:hypothetical protein